MPTPPRLAPSRQVPSVRRSPLNVSKDETPRGHGAEGQKLYRRTKQTESTCSAGSLPLPHSPSLSLSTLSLQECFLCVCVSALLRLSRVSLLKCPFLWANEAGQNGCWPQHSRCVCVCVSVRVCSCPVRLVCLHWCESCRVQ